jgi:hypothetical protein
MGSGVTITRIGGAVDDRCLRRVRTWLGDFLDVGEV